MKNRDFSKFLLAKVRGHNLVNFEATDLVLTYLESADQGQQVHDLEIDLRPLSFFGRAL